MESREFVIRVRRPWTLWILPTIAFLYFLAIVILAVMNRLPGGRDGQLLVLIGVALFALVLLVQLPFLFTRRPRAQQQDAEEGGAWAPAEEAPLAPAEPEMAPPVAPAAGGDDELAMTPETQKGLRVLEYSAPAKSANKGAVYAKTYVPVTKEFVMRVETLAADRHEI